MQRARARHGPQQAQRSGGSAAVRCGADHTHTASTAAQRRRHLWDGGPQQSPAALDARGGGGRSRPHRSHLTQPHTHGSARSSSRCADGRGPRNSGYLRSLRYGKRGWAVPTMRQSGDHGWATGSGLHSDGQRRTSAADRSAPLQRCHAAALTKRARVVAWMRTDLQRVKVEKHAEVAANLHAPHALPARKCGQACTGPDCAASPCPPRPLRLTPAAAARELPRPSGLFVSRGYSEYSHRPTPVRLWLCAHGSSRGRPGFSSLGSAASRRRRALL